MVDTEKLGYYRLRVTIKIDKAAGSDLEFGVYADAGNRLYIAYASVHGDVLGAGRTIEASFVDYYSHTSKEIVNVLYDTDFANGELRAFFPAAQATADHSIPVLADLGSRCISCDDAFWVKISSMAQNDQVTFILRGFANYKPTFILAIPSAGADYTLTETHDAMKS